LAALDVKEPIQLGFGLGELLVDVFHGLIFTWNFELPSGTALAVTVLDGAIEEGEHLIKLLLRERIEFVVVALGAAESQTEKCGCRGAHPVEHRLDPKLLRINPAFLI